MNIKNNTYTFQTITVQGRLGKQPIVRRTKKGSLVLNLSVCTTRSWLDKASGSICEENMWHYVVMYGPLAEEYAKTLNTGDLIKLSGELVTNNWEDRNGNMRYGYEIKADRIKLKRRAKRNISVVIPQPVAA